MNPTLEEIKYDAKALFVIYVLLTCYCCYTAIFDYYFADKFIYSILLLMAVPFAIGYLHKSFVALIFLDTFFIPLNSSLVLIFGDKIPVKLEPYQYADFFINMFTNLPYMAIIMYFLGYIACEYYKNHKEDIRNKYFHMH